MEYEDVDRIKSSGIRTTLLAASFISKLRSPFQRKTGALLEAEPEESWSDHWEATSSIRRPRKTVAEQNQHRMLQRAKSDLHCFNPTGPTTTANSPRKQEISRQVSRQYETLNFGNLQYEGTIEDASLSPRMVGRSKSRRGGSLKEKKSTTNDTDESSKMRRCHSTKERRKSNKTSGKIDSHPDSQEKVPSRKNSMEKHTQKRHGHEQLSNKSSKDNDSHVKSPTREIPKSGQEKHSRHGSLKERGEIKGKKGIKSRILGLNKHTSDTGSKSSITKQKSFSTESSPIESPSPSSSSKDKKFKF